MRLDGRRLGAVPGRPLEELEESFPRLITDR